MPKSDSVGKKVNSLLEEGLELKNENKFEEALKKLQDAVIYIRTKIKDLEDQKPDLARVKSEIDNVYVAKIKDLIAQSDQLAFQKKFKDAFNKLNEAQKVSDNIGEVSLNGTQKSIIKKQNKEIEIKSQVNQADELRRQNKFEEAITMLQSLKTEATSIYKAEAEIEKLFLIKKNMDQVYISQSKFMAGDATQLNQKGKQKDAIELLEEAIKICENISDINSKGVEIVNLKDQINSIYSTQIQPLLEKSKPLIAQKKKEDAIKELKNAEKIAVKMYKTDQRKKDLERIGDLLNPIFVEKIDPLMEKGNQLTTQKEFKESITVINEAVNVFRSAFKFANDMSESDLKDKTVKDVGDILNQSCSTGINLKKEMGLQLISDGKFEEAISEIYSALSLAKYMACAESDNVEIENLKDIVNQVYLAQINVLLGEANQFVEKKELDDARKIYNKALDLTNKMYLSETVDNEKNKIKNLIYQIELKQVISSGFISEEKEKFDKELVKLNEELKDTSQIQNTERKNELMSEIKRKIDKVHSNEIKFLIEQGIELAGKEQYEEGNGIIKTALGVINLIESLDLRNKELSNIIRAILEIGKKTTAQGKFGLAMQVIDTSMSIIELLKKSELKNVEYVNVISVILDVAKQSITKNKYDEAFQDYEKALMTTAKIENVKLKSEQVGRIKNAYKQDLNEKAKIESEAGQYDNAIKYANTAIEQDPDFALSYFNLGNAFLSKKEYDRSIDAYQKTVNLNPQNIDAFNKMGLSYEFKGEYDNAINVYNRALGIDSNNSVSWYYRGNAYQYKGMFDDAIESYKRAADLDPNLANAWFFMGYAFFNKKQFDIAFSTINKAIQLKPELDEGLMDLIENFNKTVSSLQEKLNKAFTSK